MKRILLLLALLATPLLAVNTPNTPVTKKADGTNLINEDLVFGSGRTLDVSAATVAFADGQIPWAKLTAVPSASTSATGVVELATSDETITGTDTVRAVTPAADKAALDAKVDPLINARASRQALVCDGAGGASMPGVALGVGDFSVAMQFKPASFASNGYLMAPSSVGAGFALAVTNTAKIQVINYVTAVVLTSSRTLIAATDYAVVVTRTGGTVYLYINGVLDVSASDSQNYTNATGIIGKATDDTQRFVGSLTPPTFYNYALSGAQVARLFATGAPDSTDLFPGGVRVLGANTFNNEHSGWFSVGSGTITDHSGYATFTGTIPDWSIGRDFGSALVLLGHRYRMTVDIRAGSATSVTGGFYTYTNPTLVQAQAIPGDNTWRTYTFEFSFNETGPGGYVFRFWGSSAWDMRNWSVEPCATVAAPDLAWDGLGNYWPDASGAGNHTTLSAGVKALLRHVHAESAPGIYARSAPLLSVDVPAGTSVTTGQVLASVDVTGAAWGEWLVANQYTGRYYIGGYYGDGGNNLGVAMELKKTAGFQSSTYGSIAGLEAEVISTSVTRLKIVAVDTQTVGRSSTIYLFQLSGGLNSANVK